MLTYSAINRMIYNLSQRTLLAADAELDKMCRDYWRECGKVETRKATPKEIQRLEMRLANY